MSKVFLLIVILVMYLDTNAQQIISIDGTKNIIDFEKNIQFYEDKNRNLNIEQIKAIDFQQNFKEFPSEILNLGASSSALWLKIKANIQTNKKYYLFIDHVSLDSVFFYFKDKNDNYQYKKTGKNFPLRVENIPLTHCVIEIPNYHLNQTQTFYVRLTSLRYLYVKSNIIAHEIIIDFLIKKYMIEFIYFGIIIFAVLYNLFIYLSVKDVSYLYYVIYTFLIGISTFIARGYFALIFPEYSQFILKNNYVIGLLYSPFVTLFTISFLKVKQHSLLLYRTLQIVLLILSLQILATIFGYNKYIFVGGIILLFFNRFLHIFVGIVIYYKGYKPAIYYLLSWGMFTLMTTISILSFSDFLPIYSFTEYLTFTAVAIETIICSLALANRINIFKKESRRAQQENLNLIKKQKKMLKKKVKKRTIDLEEKNQEIEIQNQELHQQKEELKIINENLEGKNQEIEAQNEELNRQKTHIVVLKNSLENIVNQRTNELKSTLDNLTKQNQDLSQFSFIISHNLRAPTARILGLMNIFNEKDYNDDFNKEIINHLKQTTIDLDVVIKDLTKIISIRNDLNKIKEKIDIIEVITLEKFLLQDEIEKAKAVIQIELFNKSDFFSIKSYVQSILHNLISNAIKYKSNKRTPIIVIKVETVDDFICLSVQDNGLGIDLENIDTYKIFGLYQRMHDHVEGKGMGLFLVKTQIESLGGRIEIESELDVGTTFKVYFLK